MEGKTTIQVSRETKNLLAQLGRKDDTYDDIITKLINYYQEHSCS